MAFVGSRIFCFAAPGWIPSTGIFLGVAWIPKDALCEVPACAVVAFVSWFNPTALLH